MANEPSDDNENETIRRRPVSGDPADADGFSADFGAEPENVVHFEADTITGSRSAASGGVPGPASDGLYFPPVRTTPSIQEFRDAAAEVWPEASLESLGVVWAQYAFETGRGANCWNNNIGNVKKVNGDGWDYTMLPGTWEIIGGVRKTFNPPDPQTWFRVFPSFVDGMREHLEFLQKRYFKAWSFVISGDAAGFVRALKANGYFTGNEKEYRDGVVSLQSEFVRTVNKGQPRTPAQVLAERLAAIGASSPTGASAKLVAQSNNVMRTVLIAAGVAAAAYGGHKLYMHYQLKRRESGGSSEVQTRSQPSEEPAPPLKVQWVKPWEAANPSAARSIAVYDQGPQLSALRPLKPRMKMHALPRPTHPDDDDQEENSDWRGEFA